MGSYPDSVRFLYAIGNELKGAKLGLERMRALLAKLDHPERATRFIHVAGTNGKGSVCAMIEAGLRAAGSRTGLYSSPHLVEPTERIRINGVPVSEEQFAAAFESVHAVAGGDDHPSYFETVTAMAFLLFRDAGVERVVLETGLGGRLDATNIVTPELCVITPVDFDHQQYLGNTIEQIAAEKAGILMPGVPAVFAAQRPEVRAVLRAHAQGPVHETSEWRPVHDLRVTARGCSYHTGGLLVQCPLAGRHQIENSLAAAMTLNTLGVPVDGIAQTVWPGRLEHVQEAPCVILDGAHNPAGMQALAAYLGEFYANRRITLVFAAMKDKNPREMLETIEPLVTQVVVTAPDTLRAMAPAELQTHSSHPQTCTLPDVASAVAWSLAQPPDDVIVFAGSLFLVGEARSLLVQ